MDLLPLSMSWRSCLGRSVSAARDSGEEDEDFSTRLDFPVGYDSEEEQQREMEESLYCQMYIEASSVKSVENSEAESDYHVCDLSNSDISLTLHSKENEKNTEGEEMKHGKRQRNEKCTDVAKSHKKLKKSCMIADTSETLDKKLLPKKLPEEETVSISDSKTSDKSFNSSEVVLLPSDSEKSEVSDSEPYLVEDKSEPEENAQRQRPVKNKRNKKLKEKEVIDISDTSSDSSLFLDISCDDDDSDDIDVHMVKLHDECDRGEDDEHLQAVLNSLPAECDWKINNTDRFGSSYGEKSRYYNSASKFRCNNCNHRGHFVHACPEPKKEKACILCGNRGHLSRYCCQSLCFRCNRPGHAAKECDRKRIWHDDACHRCGIQGHVKSDCPDNWRQYHLTTGSSEIVKGPKMENHRKFCYNCAACGHFGHECRRRRQDNYVQPSLPFIFEYDRNRGNRSQAKDATLQREILSASVAGKESFLEQHSESQSPKEGDHLPSSELLNQTDLQFEGKTPEKSNRVNQDRVEYDKHTEAGKDNSSQWTSFARKIHDKVFGMKLKSAKNSVKKPKKARNMDYLPLTTNVSGSEVNTQNSFQRCTDFRSKVKAPRSDVSSLSESVICRTPIDGPYVGDFPRSNVKAWKNQDSLEFNKMREDSRLSNYSAERPGVCYSKKMLFATPKDLKPASNRLISSRKFEWLQTSTPESYMNGHRQKSHELSTHETGLTGHRRRSREFCASEMQQDQMLEAYYGKKQIRNAKRKERKKKRRVTLALDKANLSVNQSGKKRRSTERGIETERGSKIRVL